MLSLFVVMTLRPRGVVLRQHSIHNLCCYRGWWLVLSRSLPASVYRELPELDISSSSCCFVCLVVVHPL